MIPGDEIPIVAVGGWFGVDTTPVVRALVAEHPGAAVLHGGWATFAAAADAVAAEEDVAWIDECGCCGLRLDIRRFLMARARRRSPPEVAVVQLAPGSDPLLVHQTVLGEHLLSRTWRPLLTVVVVDAFTVATRHALGEPPLVGGPMVDQVAAADVVVVTGAASLTAAAVAQVRAAIRAANDVAAILVAPSSRRLRDELARLGSDEGADVPARPIESHPSIATAPPDGIVTFRIAVPGWLDPARLDGWLHDLHVEPGADLLRLAGVLAVESEPNRWQVRGTRRVLEIVDGPPWGDAAPLSQLRIVGREVDVAALSHGLSACTGRDAC